MLATSVYAQYKRFGIMFATSNKFSLARRTNHNNTSPAKRAGPGFDYIKLYYIMYSIFK